MEWKDLSGFVVLLVLVAMVLGIGLITFDKFGDAAKATAPISEEAIAIADDGTGTTTNDDVISISSLKNETGDIVLILTDPTTFNWSSDGNIWTNISWADNLNITYVYKADSTTTTVMGNAVDATTPIASTWIPLIVTVSVLAIILGLVITSFARRGKR